jgi:hypothetical protein
MRRKLLSNFGYKAATAQYQALTAHDSIEGEINPILSHLPLGLP